MRIPTKLCGIVLGSLLCSAPWLPAQTSPAAPAVPKSAVSNASYPEQGYLSASRYVNQYFGFSFDLPPDALRPVAEPVAHDGSYQLLKLVGPPPADAVISIAAIPTSSGKNQDAKTYLRGALDEELYRGVEELRGLSKANLAGHQFYLFETRRGIDQHVLLATTSGDYIVRVLLAAHDDKTVKRLESCFEHLAFFPPTALRQYVESDARPYDGPSISSHRLAMLEADPPANHIDPGKIRGDFYENPAIGFSYRIPQGWALEANGAVEPAIERDRTQENFGRPRMGRTEHRLLDACSRTLFSVWTKRPGANGQIAYDDFGEVTVSAMSMACFPRMKFPENSTDRQAARDFLLQFGLTHPILDDMRDGKVFTADGSVFLYLHGTVGFSVPNDALARRLSIAMAITERRGYLLTWFFAAPHDKELQSLTDERVIFDTSPPAKVEDASQPRSPESAAKTPATSAAATNPTSPPSASSTAPTEAAAPQMSPSSSSPTAGAPATASSSSANSPAPGASNPPASAGDPAQPQNPQASSQPTLLRPGETIEKPKEKGTLKQR